MQQHVAFAWFFIFIFYLLFSGSTITWGQPNARLAVIGDFGTDTEREADVARLVHNWQDQHGELHVVAVGDANYPSGSRSTIDANVGKYYSKFMYPYKGKYGKGQEKQENRFWPCPGNHDYGGDPREGRPPGDLSPYLDYMPVGGRRFYDVRIGPLHLFSLDSDRHQNSLNGTSADSQQAMWLKAQLANSTAPWRVVFFHHPPYSSGSHGSAPYMRWPFEEWGATAVLSGHDHSYERIMFPGGFPYFVNGMGGARTYGFQLRPVPGSVLRHTGGVGAQRVDVSDRHITFAFYAAKSHTAIDCYGAMLLQPHNTSSVLYANCTDLQEVMDMQDRATVTNDISTLQLLEVAQRKQHAARTTSARMLANGTMLSLWVGGRPVLSHRFNVSDEHTCLPLHTLCNAARPHPHNLTCCQPYVCLNLTRRCGYFHNTTSRSHGKSRWRGNAPQQPNKDLDQFGW